MEQANDTYLALQFKKFKEGLNILDIWINYNGKRYTLHKIDSYKELVIYKVL
jgi:hypothetical protein